MALLHNRINNEELKQKLYEETEPRTTLSFYKYFQLADPAAFRDDLYAALSQLQVFGRIYVAQEGINAQISVPQSNYHSFVQALYKAHPALDKVRLNVAVADDGKSFWVLRIKVRKKIVADGIEDPTFDSSNMGQHVDASAFNQLTDDPNTIVVDMRNHYEYEVGHFENALEIPSDTFREQLPMAAAMLQDAKDKNIVMYCTGGIRCEKASAYLKHQGFTQVFQLEGGIIHYAQQAKEQGLPLKFKGKNFVFDERLGERITEEVLANCHQCGEACDAHTNCKNEACHLLFIQCEKCASIYNGCCSTACTQVLALPEEERIAKRKGIRNGTMIFNKSKDHPLRKHRSEWKDPN